MNDLRVTNEGREGGAVMLLLKESPRRPRPENVKEKRSVNLSFDKLTCNVQRTCMTTLELESVAHLTLSWVDRRVVNPLSLSLPYPFSAGR